MLKIFQSQICKKPSSLSKLRQVRRSLTDEKNFKVKPHTRKNKPQNKSSKDSSSPISQVTPLAAAVDVEKSVIKETFSERKQKATKSAVQTEINSVTNNAVRLTHTEGSVDVTSSTVVGEGNNIKRGSVSSQSTPGWGVGLSLGLAGLLIGGSYAVYSALKPDESVGLKGVKDNNDKVAAVEIVTESSTVSLDKSVGSQKDELHIKVPEEVTEKASVVSNTTSVTVSVLDHVKVEKLSSPPSSPPVSMLQYDGIDMNRTTVAVVTFVLLRIAAEILI